MTDAEEHAAASTLARAERRSGTDLYSGMPPYNNIAFSPAPLGKEEVWQYYFLDACRLCRRPLGSSVDIFMYRGDIPFCSEECRQEQIHRDEAREKETRRRRRGRHVHPAAPTDLKRLFVPASDAAIAG